MHADTDPHVLYDSPDHQCLAFCTLVGGEGIQSNQFLIVDHGRGCIIDPGGDLTYTPLSIQVSKRLDLRDLDLVLASHQDPDVITSLPLWLMQTDCKVVCSDLWIRFLPHLASTFLADQMRARISNRIVALPDEGAEIRRGASSIKALPAHFLHSVGNFQFYDTTSRILFSGDMGASLVEKDPGEWVQDFDAHVAHMEAFHRRYMVANRACRLWANMVKTLDVEMIVPQHGRPFRGKQMIGRFLDWVAHLRCGVDLITQHDYRVP